MSGADVRNELIALAPSATRAVFAERDRTADDLISALADLRRAVSAGPASTGGSIDSIVERVRAEDLLVRARYAAVRRRLAEGVVGAIIVERLDHAEARYQEGIDAILRAAANAAAQHHGAGATSGGRPRADLREAVYDALRAALDERAAQDRAAPATLRASTLPYRRAELAPRPPVLGPTVRPSYLDPTDPPAAPTDFSGGPDANEAALAPEIAAKAESLGFDATRIYAYVRNQIATEWYAGGMKGALETMRQCGGNDIDQASLLIALLRSSQLAARYVHGVAELPVERLAAELGVAEAQVPAALARAGIAHRVVVRGGRVAAIELEQTWVSARVPYANYRGAVVDFSGQTWIPLAPALKTSVVRPSTAVLREMDLDVSAAIAACLAASQTATPLALLRTQVETYLATAHPGALYADQLGDRSVVAEDLGLLPSSLPMTVVAVTSESSTLDPVRKHRIRLVVRGGLEEDAPILLDTALDLSQVAGERVTLSYLPATVDDHRVVNLFGGLGLVPAYLVDLRPQIKVAGRTIQVGAPLPMAVAHRVEIELSGPYGDERVEQTVWSGSYLAVAVGAQRTVLRPDDGTEPHDTEHLAARLLSRLALGYSAHWDDAERELAGLLDAAVIRPLPALAIAGNAIEVTTLFGLAQSLEWRGVTLDAALRVAEPIGRPADPSAGLDWMRFSALTGSALEHVVFETDFLTDAISADKGLGLARQQGIEIVRVDAANAGTVVPGLALPAAVQAEIANAARLGLVVDVPRTELQRYAWRGAAWRVEDEETGDAGYFLAGGLAGGATTEEPDNWILGFLAQALAAPYSAEPNTDPMSGTSVRKLVATDGQEGTAGERLPLALAVLVTDVDGRPVQGAPVAFAMAAGGGLLTDGEGAEGVVASVVTNRLGVASVPMRLGTSTALHPVYLLRAASDRYATQALDSAVEVAVASASGSFLVDQPFTATGYPGLPVTLRRTDPFTDPTLFQIPGLWLDTVLLAIEDEFGNPVSNVEVEITATDRPPVGPQCTNETFAPLPSAVFDTRAGCPHTFPSAGDCGSPNVTLPSSVVGVPVGVIAPNVVGMGVDVAVESGSLTPLAYRYVAEYFQDGQDGECWAAGSSLRLNMVTQTNANGDNIQAIPTGGTSPPMTLGAALFLTGTAEFLGADGHPYIGHYLDGDWFPVTETRGPRLINPESGGVVADYRLRATPVVVVDNGVSHSALVETAAMQYDFRLQAGATVGSSPLLAHAEAIEQRPGEIPQPYGEVEGEVSGVWVVAPEILATDPPIATLTPEGRAQSAIRVLYSTLPTAYVASSSRIDRLKNGELQEILVGSSLAGAGEATLQRGNEYDIASNHTVELVLNRGEVWEVRSPPFPLEFAQGLIVEVSPSITLSQEVDVLNQRICARPDQFHYHLTRDATVRLVFKGVVPLTDGTFEYDGSEVEILSGVVRATGDHDEDILPSDLPAGLYEFELRGIATDNGQEEVERGFARSTLETRDFLSVGHTIVKGVDLFDGHLIVHREDFHIPGRGLPLSFARTYSSGAGGEPGELGLGWTHNWASKVVVTPCGEAIVVGGEGAGMRFVDDGAGGLRPLKGYHGTLIANAADSSFDFFTKSGTRYHYRFERGNEWQLESVVDPNGNTTQLVYGPSALVPGGKRLLGVVDEAGRRLDFHYEVRQFAFEQREVIKQVDGPAGLRVAFDYDLWGNLIRATREVHADGSSSSEEAYSYQIRPEQAFDDRHVLVAVRDEVRDAETTYDYGQGAIGVQGDVAVPSAFVERETEPEGEVTTFAYDRAALSTRDLEVPIDVTDPRGNTSHYRVNRYGSTLRVEDPLGNITLQTWAVDDVLMTNRTDARGVRTDYEYDVHGNETASSVPVTDVDGGAHVYREETTYASPASFDPPYIKDRIATRTDRNGVVTRHEYDQHGNRTREEILTINVDGLTTLHAVVHAYLANGDLARTTDPRGNATSYHYDTFGNLIETTSALGGKKTSVFDDRSRLVSAADELGRATSVAYDTLDRVVERILPEVADGPGSERAIYEDTARRRRVIDALGRESVESFDRSGRLVAQDNAAAGRKESGYDAAGNRILETSWFDAATPWQETVFTYDLANRLFRRTEPLGRVTTYEYDAVGNLTRETLSAAAGAFTPRVTRSVYDALNRKIEQADLIGAEEARRRFLFDGENLLGEEDPLGRRTRHRYDALDRKIETTEPEWRAGVPKVTHWLYDANGSVVEERRKNERRAAGGGFEPADQIRKAEYDALNRPTQRRDAEGKARLFEYDAVGNIVREIDPLLNVTSHAYDARNRLTATTQHLTRVTQPARTVTTEFRYDQVSNRTEERWPNGNVVTRVYDGLNRKTSSTDSIGAIEATLYDARSNAVETRDANGNVTRNSYDALNRVVRQDLPESRTITRTFDVAGNVLTETDPRGNTTTHEYDALNRLTKTTDPAPFGFTTTLTYDLAGNKLTETDRRGLTTSYSYDALNRLISTQDPLPLSHTRQFTRDAQSNLLTETDRNGVLTEHTYDRENRPLETKRAELAIERNEYDAAGNRRFVTDALGNVTGYEYDERNLLLAENLPLAAITKYTLDDMGDRRQETDPEGRATMRTFDHRRRLSTETNAAGETTAFAYDGNGNRTQKTLPKANAWAYAFDGANRLTMVIDPLEGETSYAYDGNDNRLTQQDGNGHTTSFAYDVLNRLAQKTYPDGATIASTYDANGNLVSRTDPKNQTITRTYDELDRESLATFPLPSEPTGTDLETISNEYDPNGNVLRTIEAYRGNAPPRTTVSVFDTFDRPTSITNGDGEQIRYTYDANGNRTQLTDPDGKTTQYTFDALNRTTAVTVLGAGVTNYSYFKDSRVRKVTYPNGTTATHVYDLAGRASLIENKQGPATISSFAYTYDANGNRTQQIETNGGPSETTAYSYDLADRLAGVAYPEKAVAYTYDAVGNRRTERTTDTGGTPTSDKTYVYNNRDWLLSVTDTLDPAASATYSYDANGNQVAKHQGSDTFRFLFDVRDQLVETQKNGTLVERYAFDYQGLRIKKAGSGQVVRYVYDDTSVLLQTDAAGNTISKYEWGPDRLLSIDHASEGRSFHVFDALGSVVNLAKPDGTLQASYVYDAWGVLRRETGTSANPFLFTGYEFDRETGLYYAKSRSYDPSLGRFLSEDPFAGVADTPPSLNKYAYAHDQPTYYTDPLGMCVLGLPCPEAVKDAVVAVAYFAVGLAEGGGEQGGAEADAETMAREGIRVARQGMRLLSAAAVGGAAELIAERRAVLNEEAVRLKQSTEQLPFVRSANTALTSEGAAIGGDPNRAARIAGRGTGAFVEDVALALGLRAGALGRARSITTRAQNAVTVEGDLGVRTLTGQGTRSAPAATSASSTGADVSYLVDDAGLTVRAEGRITGPHRGRGKGYRPEPVGGRAAGEHRGHLIPEGGVDQPGLVNVRENIISETAASNLGPKKALDNLVSRIAAENPNSDVRIVAEPLRGSGRARPFAVTYWIEKDGVRITGQTILNK